MSFADFKEKVLRPVYLPASFVLGALTLGLRTATINFEFGDDVSAPGLLALLQRRVLPALCTPHTSFLVTSWCTGAAATLPALPCPCNTDMLLEMQAHGLHGSHPELTGADAMPMPCPRSL
jgi:hypothetical protein